jgi:hypothetical protein
MKKVYVLVLLLLLMANLNIVVWNLIVLFGENQTVSNQILQVAVPLDTESQVGEILPDIESGILTGFSSTSLEMKENVDFLLTPAILVQECISEDVIITYPDE